MPHPLWRHTCGGTHLLIRSPICSTCGNEGEFHGWRLSVHESMARYQYVYGLKPIGPHRQVADDLLFDLRAPCPRCLWDGIITVEGGGTWRMCPVCEGTGGFWTPPDEQVEAVRQEILKQFPDAAARSLPGFVSVGVVLDLGSNEIVAVPRREREAGPREHPDEGTS
jgi:hypothetical protein